mmetsp:Transcript_65034/g.105142  ORF Transcript_65034/g.105142 Transcript_65034/m.105142 type:complete len:81 (-) Transcript_65034:133-375(-)
MAVGRLPSQAVFVWIGVSLKGAGQLLFEGESSMSEGTRRQLLVAGALLGVCGLAGLYLLARRAHAVYRRLCEAKFEEGKP